MYHLNALLQINTKADLIKSRNEILNLGFPAAEHAADSFTEYLDNYLDNYDIGEGGKYLSFDFVDNLSMGIDTSTYFNIRIDADKDNTADADRFVQALLFELISKENSNVHLRLCDRKNAGSGYGRVLQVVHSDAKKYGGGIYSDDTAIAAELNEIVKTIEERMVLIAGKYENVFEYNKNEKNKLPIVVLCIYYLNGVPKTTLDKFLYIQKNAEKGGICILNISDIEQDYIECTQQIRIEGNNAVFKMPEAPMSVAFETKDATDEDIEGFCAKKLVSSLAEDYFDLDNEIETLRSDKCIHVPFAVDEFGNIIEFEVGGKAPAHALLSGSTGSGKSVLLHTIIDSIILHYHPDDVEIWAVDYKAVEFACYVKRRTPHISVIGQDKSEDFSFSLLELINKEYERRKKLFLDANVTKLEDYRARGNQLSRILIVIDEFHNLTQAVQTNQQYKTMLENLLSEMRAMGMSFLFSSQTISSGLQGLTEKGKRQIGCRICMKQTSMDEIRATLNEAYAASTSLNDILSFGTGQAIYKKEEESGYSFNQVRVLYIKDDMRDRIMDIAESKLPADYKKRKEVICKDSNRYSITDKPDHALNRFIAGKEMPVNEEGIFIYPAAPTSLEDEFVMKLDKAPSNNLLTVIEDNELRESVLIYSIMSLLAVPDQKVNVSLVDDSLAFSKTFKAKLDKLEADNLKVFYGGKESFDHIYSLEKLKPVRGGNQIEVFYGLHKTSSLIYMLNSENEDADEADTTEKTAEEPSKTPGLLPQLNFDGMSDEEKMASLMNLKSMILAGRQQKEEKEEKPEPPKEKKQEAVRKEYKEDEIKKILEKLCEFGPDFGYFSILAFNNAKQFKQVEPKWIRFFEHRLGGMMSADDSYSIFTTEYFVNKADEQTLVYYSGSSKNVKTMRPYLLADDDYFEAFRKRVKGE